MNVFLSSAIFYTVINKCNEFHPNQYQPLYIQYVLGAIHATSDFEQAHLSLPCITDKTTFVHVQDTVMHY